MCRGTRHSGLRQLTRLGALSGLLIASAADAQTGCDERVIPVEKQRWGSNQQAIAFGKADQQTIRKIIFPSTDCRLTFGAEHGSHHFYCSTGNSEEFISGQWNPSSEEEIAARLEISPQQKRRFPAHKNLRKTLLAPAFTEGYYIYYPKDLKTFFALYPQKLTAIGKQIVIENPDARVKVQSIQYRTMNRRPRAAVTGEAAIGCLKLSFVTWVSPAAAQQTERKMKQFLGDLRLGPASPL